MQLINVCLGGTLHQHLPELTGGERHRPAPGVYGTVRVRLDPASCPVPSSGPVSTCPVTTIRRSTSWPTSLTASGWAADGTVEAVWAPGRRFVLGVQWHPEVRDDPALFAALVRAAAERAPGAEPADPAARSARRVPRYAGSDPQLSFDSSIPASATVSTRWIRPRHRPSLGQVAQQRPGRQDRVQC
jgi:putative glutamine amidotransferase